MSQSRFDFRSMHVQDLPMLTRWLSEPHVARWWGPSPAPEKVAADYGPDIGNDDGTGYFILDVAHEAVGFCQCYRITDEPEWSVTLDATGARVDLATAAGLDCLIGDPGRIGR